jgi:mRNA interferase MazF
MKLSPGDLLLARFPYTDLSDDKRRPVVVLPVENDGEDVIVCAITSKSFTGAYDIAAPDSLDTGLKVPSIVQFDKIATLAKTVISGRIGAMPREFMTAHKPLLLRLLGLESVAAVKGRQRRDT